MEGAALRAVLLASRALGAAPGSRDADARWRVSRPLLLYSGLLSTVIGVYLVAHSSYAVLSQSGPVPALGYIRVASRCAAALALGLGTSSAPARLRRAARTGTLLRQIKAMLPHGRRKDQKRAIVLMLSSFACCLATRIVDISTSAHCFQNVFTIMHQCAIIFAYFVESLIILQIILIARQVAGSLADINDGLKDLAPDQYSHSSMTMLGKKDKNIENEDIVRKLPKVAWEVSLPESENPIINLNTNQNIVNDNHSHINKPTSQYDLSAPTLRRRAARYAALCDALREANAVDGLYMAAVLVLFSLRLGIVLYEIILWGLLVDQLNISNLTTPLLLCALLLANLVSIIEPFHAAHVQMQRTHFLLINLKLCCRDDERVTNELDLFLRLLKLNKAAYSPLGLCTLERSITVTIFATIATYLVVALTYGPEAKNPALFVINYYNGRCGQF